MPTLLRNPTPGLLLLLTATLVATAPRPASAVTMVSFDLDVTIVQTGGQDDMGNILGDFGLAEGQVFTDVGVLTLVSGEPDADGFAELVEVSAFDLTLGSAELSWDVSDLLESLGYLGYVVDGEVGDVHVPNAENEEGVSLGHSKKAPRKKATRKKATSVPTFVDTIDIFDDENFVIAEVTLRQRTETPVPEPGAMALFATAALLVTWRLRSSV